MKRIGPFLIMLAILLIPAGRMSVLTIAGRTPDLFFVDLAMFVAILWCGAALPYVARLWRTGWAPFLVFLVMVLAGMLRTPDYLGYLASMRPVMYAVASACIVATSVRSAKVAEQLLVAVIVAVAAIGVVLFVVVGPEGLTALGDKTEVELDWGRSNYFATFSIVGAFVSFGFLRAPGPPLRRLLAGLCLFCAIVLLLETKSRAALLAFMAVAAIGIPMMRSGRRTVVKRKGSWVKYAWIIGGLVLLGLAAPYVLELIGADPEKLVDSGNLRRVDAWVSALSAFASSPIVGIGWENTTLMLDSLTETATTTHSLPLQTLAETGLVGFISLFMVVRRSLRPAGPDAKFLLDVRLRDAMRLAVIGALSHCLVEPSFWGTSFTVVIWTLIALLYNSAGRPVAVRVRSVQRRAVAEAVQA